MPGVNIRWMRPELKNAIKKWEIIDDCIEGELAIKERGVRYLPMPNPTDLSEDNRKRYEAYKMRAVFYNVTARTLSGLIGQIFIRKPQITLPTGVAMLEKDATGEGVPLDQLATNAATAVLSKGRCGLFVDYPAPATGVVTKADLNGGDIRPTISMFGPRSIINWRVTPRGGRQVLSLVVINEFFTSHDDGFELKNSEQFRVLRLLDPETAANRLNNSGKDLPPNLLDPLDQSSSKDIYVVEVWRQFAGGVSWVVHQEYFPTDSTGAFLNEIPFTFIGSISNNADVAMPPLFDLASLNIHHYQNSAENEDSAYLVGQPMLAMSGLTRDWVDNVLKGSIAVGSRASLALPSGADAKLLQINPNTAPAAGMEAKERQMVALGARLVQQQTVQRTATEADIENTADTSVLATVAKNVAAGVRWALEKACVFTGDAITDKNLIFLLNTEFDLTSMSPAEQQSVVGAWQNEAITWGEMRSSLKRAGVATEDDDKAKAEIAQDSADRAAAAVELMQATAAGNAPAPVKGGPEDPKEPPEPK